MNFLAHLYLSGNDEKLMVGNFIGDFVKGKKLFDFESRIRQGIELHRLIDQYTDSHDIVNQSKDHLRGKYRHYSGVIVDMYYDHFLAKNWKEYHKSSLLDYTVQSYNILLSYKKIIPKKALNMLEYMIPNNWLFNYRSTEGIVHALSGMARRTRFDSKMNESSYELNKYYAEFENEFKIFFSDLQLFTVETQEKFTP